MARWPAGQAGRRSSKPGSSRPSQKQDTWNCPQRPRLARDLRRAFCGLALLLGIAGAFEATAAPAEKLDAPPSVGTPAVPMVPDPYKINMLIRTTLIALNQANQTGNYSVLRDLGAPEFQAMNSDARLAEIFGGLRQRNLDLSPVLFFNPTLLRNPAVQDNGILRMTGFLDTKPQRVLFDMGFQWVGGDWRLAAIVVDIKTPQSKPDEPTAKAKKDGEAQPASRAKDGSPKEKSSHNRPKAQTPQAH